TRWRSLGDRLADLPEVDHPHASGPVEHPAVSVILREARLPARGVSRLDQLELGARGLKHRRRPRIGWRSAEISRHGGPVVRRPQVRFPADQQYRVWPKRMRGVPPVLSASSLRRQEVARLVLWEPGPPKQERDAQLHKVPQTK